MQFGITTVYLANLHSLLINGSTNSLLVIPIEPCTIIDHISVLDEVSITFRLQILMYKFSVNEGWGARAAGVAMAALLFSSNMGHAL